MTESQTLEAKISQLTIVSMKAHDAERTGTLRLIKTALKNKQIDKREALTPAEEQQVLATMIKQRRDSIEQFTKGNRPELAAKEAAEIVVIEEFLPFFPPYLNTYFGNIGLTFTRNIHPRHALRVVGNAKLYLKTT